MPIPFTPSLESQKEHGPGLRLLPKPNRGSQPSLIFARLTAHFMDISVVFGFSAYLAKFFTFIAISFHRAAISGSGRSAGVAFEAAYQYASANFLAASFALISIAYLVGLPMIFGRTLGMGLLGIRVFSEDGSAPTLRQMLLRLLGCAFAYASFGILCLIGLRQRDGRFFQDILSRTRVEPN